MSSSDDRQDSSSSNCLLATARQMSSAYTNLVTKVGSSVSCVSIKEHQSEYRFLGKCIVHRRGWLELSACLTITVLLEIICTINFTSFLSGAPENNVKTSPWCQTVLYANERSTTTVTTPVLSKGILSKGCQSNHLILSYAAWSEPCPVMR